MQGHSDLNFGALDPRESCLDASPDQVHCVAFSGKTLNSHSAACHPGEQKGTSEFNAGSNPAMD